MPCDGKITAINVELEDEPQHITTSAEQDGWLMEFEIGDNAGFEGLLDEKAYLEYVENLDEDDH